MEGNYLTTGDLALWDRRDDHYCYKGHGAATTGIGLAAGLGGGALLLAIAGLWGVNKAGEARAQGARDLATANGAALAMLNNSIITERNSRENWQAAQAPSIKNYVDVQSQPTTVSASSSFADAYATALAFAQANNGGLNSAIGNDSYLKIMRYSAPQPCPCGCGD